MYRNQRGGEFLSFFLIKLVLISYEKVILKMKDYKLIKYMTLLIFLVGCQSQDVTEVVNEHNKFTNLEDFEQFFEDVTSKQSSSINYVRYGVEGQRGVMKLVYDGQVIKVTDRVDNEFVQEFSCLEIKREVNEISEKYMLLECLNNRNETLDIDLFSIKQH